MNKIAALFILLLLQFFPASAAAVSAEEGGSPAGKIILVSEVRDDELKFLIESLPARRDEQGLKILAARITEQFHERGYALSYVDEIVLRKDGYVEARMRDPVVEEITVTGTARASSAVIFLSPLKGGVFNSISAERYLSDMNRRFSFAGSSAEILQGQAGGVILGVKAEEKKFRLFYGSALNLPAGQYPYAGVEYLRGVISLGTSGGMTFGSGDVSAARAEFTAASIDMVNRWAPFAALKFNRRNDYYERYGYEFSSEAYSVSAGLRRDGDIFIISAAASIALIDPEGYRGFTEKFYLSKISAEISGGNSPRLINKREGYSARLSSDAGYEGMEKKIFLSAEGGAQRGFYLIHDLRSLMVIPFASFYLSSSRERFFLPYVYDSILFSAGGDYSSSCAKGSSGARIDYALAEDFIFAAFSSGFMIFRDEYGKIKSVPGCSAGIVLERSNFVFSGGWAWDPFNNISKGGFYLSLSGRGEF